MFPGIDRVMSGLNTFQPVLNDPARLGQRKSHHSGLEACLTVFRILQKSFGKCSPNAIEREKKLLLSQIITDSLRCIW